MQSARDRRLQADAAKVRHLVDESGNTLRLVSISGAPPTRYVIEYHCRSFGLGSDGQPTERMQHQVEITLGANYPFEMPSARMLTPVFNPHVYTNQAICLGHRWMPNEALDTLVLKIGALLQFDPMVLDFNSLANQAAGRWARDNRGRLPLDHVTFHAPKRPRERIQWFTG